MGEKEKEMANKHPAFIIHQEYPYNGETPLNMLTGSFLTSTDLFYVRTHGNIPLIAPDTYRLRIHGRVGKELVLSLDDLRRQFSQQTLTATLQCAGNRRVEMMAVKDIPEEVPWGAGAVGTAEWTGVPLREVLQKAGVQASARYVALLGMDQISKDGKRFPFGGSIPIEKAMRPEVLLAYAMNGAPLEPAHGSPLRLIVPGYIGARSVKWLSDISLQETPSDNYYFTRGYQLYPPGIDSASVDGAQGIKLGEFNINAAICRPQEGVHLSGDGSQVQVQGYALAGGERGIERVEVSVDGGETWTIAELLSQPLPWSWRLWQAGLDLKPGIHQIVVRAWDSSAQTQPENIKPIWNLKGYMNNAWQRINISVGD